MAKRLENYISKDQYEAYSTRGFKYEGYVIGYGYVYWAPIAVMPPHLNGYNPIGRLYGQESEVALCSRLVEDFSKEARKESLKVLFKNGEAVFTVQKGSTLGGIAKFFGVTVNQLDKWNGFKDVNKIYVGQPIRILLPEHPDYNKDVNDLYTTTNVNARMEQMKKSVNAGSVEKTIKPQTGTQSLNSVDASKWSDWSISKTNTDIKKYEIDLLLVQLNSFTEEVSGNARIFNHNFTKEESNGGFKMLSSFNINFGVSKFEISTNGLSSSMNIFGVAEIESGIEVNNFWNLSLNLNLKANINRDNTSTGVGISLKPVKVVACIAIITGAVYLVELNAAALSRSTTAITPASIPQNDLYY